MYKNFLKRVFDLTASALAILVLSWLLIIIAIVIKCDSKGPVFFKQKRVGKNKKHFTILKFRTMRTETPHDAPTHELSDPKRWITKFGSFLRKTSLDELPQIFNIFLGHMSIIGPRPALWNQFDLIEERDKYNANAVRPGLTGWAQINGRDELAIPIKAKLDGEYVERLSFLFDCKCFFGTITAVLTRKGMVEGEANDIAEEIKDKSNSEQDLETAPTIDVNGVSNTAEGETTISNEKGCDNEESIDNGCK